MIVCPKCGQENPDGTKNCAACRINLEWALADAGGIEGEATGGKRYGLGCWAAGSIVVGIGLLVSGYLQYETWACQGRAECGLGRILILGGVIWSVVGAAGLISVGITHLVMRFRARRKRSAPPAPPGGTPGRPPAPRGKAGESGGERRAELIVRQPRGG